MTFINILLTQDNDHIAVVIKLSAHVEDIQGSILGHHKSSME